MTDPTAREPRLDRLPDVDEVIHEAREASWHLPETEAGRPTPGHAGEPGQPAAPPQDARLDPAAMHAVPASPPSAAGRQGVEAGRGAVGASSPAQAHPAVAGHDAAPAVPATVAHGSGHDAAAGHGSGHDAGDTAGTLGPVDVEMWGAGIVGAVIGLFIAICFVLATAGSGAY